MTPKAPKTNLIKAVIGGVAILELTGGHIVLMDASDLPLIVPYGWYLCNGYARRNEWAGNKVVKRVYLHRLLMGEPEKGLDVDHISGDKKDCRRANLRVVTHAQNNQNLKRESRSNKSTGVRGVYVSKRGKVYGRVIIDSVRFNVFGVKTVAEAEGKLNEIRQGKASGWTNRQ